MEHLRLLPLAYLDPGTGAMLLQMLLAGVAGVVVFFKYQGRRFMRLFKRSPKAQDGDDAQANPSSK